MYCRRLMTTVLLTNFSIGWMAKCCQLLPLPTSLRASLAPSSHISPSTHHSTRASIRPSAPLSVFAALRPGSSPLSVHSPSSPLSVLAALRLHCSLPSPLSVFTAARSRPPAAPRSSISTLYCYGRRAATLTPLMSPATCRLKSWCVRNTSSASPLQMSVRLVT